MNSPERLPPVEPELADDVPDEPGTPASGSELPVDHEDDPSTAEEKALARAQGWRPESEWDGAPANRRPKQFLTARVYLERTGENMPMMRERLRQAGTQIVEMNGKIEDQSKKLDASGRLIRDMHENMKFVRERAYSDARVDIEREMDAAFDAGDRDRFRDSRTRLRNLDEQHETDIKTLNGGDDAATAAAPPVISPPAIAPPPEVDAWVARHPWFARNATLRTAAMEREVELKRQEENGQRLSSTLGDRLDDVADWIEDKFAEIFPQSFPEREGELEPPPPPAPRGSNPRRRTPSTVRQPGGGESVRSDALRWEDLSDDEKAAADMCVESVPGYTRADYLKDYKR